MQIDMYIGKNLLAILVDQLLQGHQALQNHPRLNKYIFFN